MDKKIAIRTENLTKRYGEHTAVNNLNLEIYEGEIFGLLGPNGAGKTTTILMLLGLTEPTKGIAHIQDYDTIKETLFVKKTVGYLPDHVGFYEDMTGRENLRFVGRLNGLALNDIEKRIDHLLERVKLSEMGNKKVGTYSRGMRQRLGIADTLMKDPKVIILDEPTLGLDPEGINEILGLIVELARKDKRTVLISSHLLHQVQKICDRVGIFVKGDLLAMGPIDTLGEKVFANQPFILELNVFPISDQLTTLIQSINEDVKVQVEEDKILVESKEDIRKKLVKILSDNDYELLFLRQSGRDLDDIYSRYFTEKR